MIAPIPSRARHSFIISAILLTTFLIQARPANAFKLRSHLMIANQAVGQIYGQSEKDALTSFGSLGPLQVQNPDVLRAVQKNLGAFRAGVLGPDVFPDLYSGQLWVHINSGNPDGLESAACGGDCVPSDVSFEARTPFTKWRAIDYGMFLLKRAQAYNGTDGRDRAVAFAYGYLAHMAGDGFAHTYVNEWTRSVFNLTKAGKWEGTLFGSATGELQHLAVEGFIDAHIPKMDPLSIQIDPPLDFLKEVFMNAHGKNEGLKEATAAGAFGGRYFEKLLKARSTMKALADPRAWDPSGVGQAISGFASLGTKIGDPVNDITSYFRQRSEIIDAALSGWLHLSKCVAQNLVSGSNQSGAEKLLVDDCASLNFESDSATAALFKGDLNRAGHYGEDGENTDFGRTALNLAKQRKFVLTLMKRAFLFDPTEDIASLKKIKTGIQNCDGTLVNWDSCDNACSNAEKTCSKVLQRITCPSICGDCQGFWGRGRCVLLGLCVACMTPAFELVTDEVCSANVRAAVPVCHACRPNPVCESLQRLAQVRAQVDLFQKKVVEQILGNLIKEMRRDLVEYYAGPLAQEMYDLHEVFEGRKANSTPAWFVNLAFLREDLQRDPSFLNDVVGKMAQVAGIAIDNGVSGAQAVASTIQQTKGSGRKVLNEIVFTTQGTVDDLWAAMVDGIVSIARDPNFQPSNDMKADRFKALDQFKFKETDKTYKSRLAKFVALLTELGALMDMRGPTARALRASMSLDSGRIDSNAGSTFFSPKSFEPVYNAIALTKLSFLGKSGLAALGSLGGVNSPTGQPFGFTAEAFNGNRPSSICTDMSHPLCDSIQSLDDPNHYGFKIASGSAVNGGTTFDASRSVALMESQVDAQGGSTSCVPGLSNFILSGTSETVHKLYEKVFLMPKRCTPDLTVDMLPTLDGVPVVVAPGGARSSSGQIIDWVVRVRNLGVSPSMQSMVTLYINGSRFVAFPVRPLQPSGEQLFSAVLETNTLGALFATATVDPSNEMVELKEDNNSSSFTFHVH